MGANMVWGWTVVAVVVVVAFMFAAGAGVMTDFKPLSVGDLKGLTQADLIEIVTRQNIELEECHIKLKMYGVAKTGLQKIVDFIEE